MTVQVLNTSTNGSKFPRKNKPSSARYASVVVVVIVVCVCVRVCVCVLCVYVCHLGVEVPGGEEVGAHLGLHRLHREALCPDVAAEDAAQHVVVAQLLIQPECTKMPRVQRARFVTRSWMCSSHKPAHTHTHTHRETNSIRQTDRQTDRQTHTPHLQLLFAPTWRVRSTLWCRAAPPSSSLLPLSLSSSVFPLRRP